MQPLYQLLDALRGGVRWVMRRVAGTLNALSGGHLSPNAITITSLLMHLPIAWLVATRHNHWAALLLVIFGLFDTLDGELARLQHRTSKVGMLLDSISDRFKEVILYLGIVYVLTQYHGLAAAVWTVGALGASLLVSYVNAWSEAVLAGRAREHEVNKSFRGGLLSFDVRMALIFLGLLTNHLMAAVITIAILASLTVFQRLRHLYKAVS